MATTVWMQSLGSQQSLRCGLVGVPISESFGWFEGDWLYTIYPPDEVQLIGQIWIKVDFRGLEWCESVELLLGSQILEKSSS
jgi:hypothetical protein